MTFSCTPTVPHDVVVVAAFDHHADAGGGGRFAVDDADLVIDKVHVGEVREVAVEGLAQGGVEGVHRAVAFGHFVADCVADRSLTRRFGDRRRRRGSRRSRGTSAARSAA